MNTWHVATLIGNCVLQLFISAVAIVLVLVAVDWHETRKKAKAAKPDTRCIPSEADDYKRKQRAKLRAAVRRHNHDSKYFKRYLGEGEVCEACGGNEHALQAYTTFNSGYGVVPCYPYILKTCGTCGLKVKRRFRHRRFHVTQRHHRQIRLDRTEAQA